jgi:hypothetical protein
MMLGEEIADLYVAIRDAIRGLTGFYGCEIGETPDPPAGQAAPGFPYSILYPIAWTPSGPRHFPEQDAPAAFQVTTVGATGQQASFNAGRIRKLLVDMDPMTGEYVTPIVVAGLVFYGRACTTAGGLESDARLQSAVDRYVFYVGAAN